MVERALAEGPLPDEHAASALWWRVFNTAGARPGWPRTPEKEVWESIDPPRRGRPEEEHLPSFGHNRDRGGPSIGF